MEKADFFLARWTKEQGLTERMLFSESIELLQTKRIATKLIKDYGRVLKEKEIFLLQFFLKNFENSDKRKKITKTNCYEIMNIGKRINRKEFKQKRKLKQSFK